MLDKYNEFVENCVIALNDTAHHFEASAIISIDSIIITSVFPSNIDEDYIKSIITAIASATRVGIQKCAKGDLEEMLVEFRIHRVNQ
jgi:predicted regulator of Ras-like GTPase activity (Roadblock/LC7/MglB family)